MVSEDADVVHDVGLIGLAVYRCGQDARHLLGPEVLGLGFGLGVGVGLGLGLPTLNSQPEP